MRRDWINNALELPEALAQPVEINHDQLELIEELWDRPDTLVLPMREGHALVDEDRRLALVPPAVIDEVRGRVVDDSEAMLRLYLGRVSPVEGAPDDGILVAAGAGTVPVIAVMLDEADADALTRGEWVELRTLALTIDRRDTGLLTRAAALANWHSSHRFSPKSGRPTQITKSGWVRVDEEGGEHFPRTDPAIIVAVTDADERLLLGSNAAWEEQRFSLIAGFVDPGESLEQAVIREVREEAALTVRDPKYLGSQPWPFPASLMLGFSALVAGDPGPIVPDGIEIRALRWFSRGELIETVRQGEILIPGRGSIARSIIEAWFGERIIDVE